MNRAHSTTRTTRRCAAGSNRPTTRTPTSRSRTCRSGASAAADDEAWRIGVAIGDQVLDLRARRPGRPRRHEPADGAWRRRRARALRAGAVATACATAARSASALAALRCVPQSARRDGRCPARSATTPTSTPASTTRRRSASCSAPTTRCCRTTSGCRSATTAAPRRSRASGQPFRRPARPDQGAGRRGAARCGRSAAAGLSSWNSASSSAGRNALGRADPDRRGRGPRVRPDAVQRLERARHPGLGVPAARARSCRRTSPARCRRGS